MRVHLDFRSCFRDHRHAGARPSRPRLHRQWRPHARDYVARRPAPAADPFGALNSHRTAIGVLRRALSQYRNAFQGSRRIARLSRAAHHPEQRRLVESRRKPRSPCRRGRRACRARSPSSPMGGSSRNASLWASTLPVRSDALEHRQQIAAELKRAFRHRKVAQPLHHLEVPSLHQTRQLRRQLPAWPTGRTRRSADRAGISRGRARRAAHCEGRRRRNSSAGRP